MPIEELLPGQARPDFSPRTRRPKYSNPLPTERSIHKKLSPSKVKALNTDTRDWGFLHSCLLFGAAEA